MLILDYLIFKKTARNYAYCLVLKGFVKLCLPSNCMRAGDECVNVYSQSWSLWLCKLLHVVAHSCCRMHAKRNSFVNHFEPE